MKKYHFTLLLLFTTIASINAQIRGVVINNENQPVIGANIVLQTPDSVFITGAVSAANGTFALTVGEKPEAPNYFLVISRMGYEMQALHLEGVVRTIDVGTIVLQPQHTELDEVVVMAARSITHTDRRLIFPPQEVVRHSTSGFDLLNRLMLAGLNVDMVNHSVSAFGGGNVLIYINHRRATQIDVIALRPDEVLRVEHIDLPGVQYDMNVAAVIHFVVRQRISGTVMGINTTNAVTTGSGRNFAFLRHNRNRSEFGVNYSIGYGVVNNRFINQTDVYTLMNDTRHTIDREGIPTHLRFLQHDVGLSYSFVVPQRHLFHARLRGSFYDSPNRGHRQRITETGQPIYYAITEPSERFHSPVIDLFYVRTFPNRQTLTTNVVGTITNTRYGFSYRTFETFTNNQFSNPISQYGFNTDGKRRSLIGEVRHFTPLGDLQLVSGVVHLQGYTQNRHTGTTDVVNEMHNTTTRFYSQLSSRANLLDFTLGIGASYHTFRQNDDSYNRWVFRPIIQVTTRPFQGGSFRYRFGIEPNIPTLASLSDVRLQVNSFEYRVGNPNLVPFWTGVHTFIFSYQHNRFFLENTLGYRRSRNTIMEEITRRTDEQGNTFFEFGFDNQKSFSELWNFISGAYHVIPGTLNVQGGLSYLVAQSEGNNYSHTFNRWWGMLRADLMLGDWNMGVSWSGRERSFFGETINTHQANSSLFVNYRLNNMTFGLNWTNIFMRDNGLVHRTETANEFVDRDLSVFVPEWRNKVSVSFTWNFNRGRAFQVPNQTIQHSDTDTGIVRY